MENHSSAEHSGLAARNLGAVGVPLNQWSGIHESLAEMGQRLGELQEQADPTQRRADPSDAKLALQAQAAIVKQQIDELLRVRELLKSSLRAVIAECERSLGQLERGEVSHGVAATLAGVPPAVGAPVSGLSSTTAPFGAATPTLAQTTTTPFGATTPVFSPAQAAFASVAPGSAPATAIAPALAPLPSVFQGSVSLRVGPLSDISQVDTLEIALLQVPGAEQVEIKEFAGRDAVAEIRLFGPVRLVEELRRVLPFTFDVTGGGETELALRVSDASAAGAPAGGGLA